MSTAKNLRTTLEMIKIEHTLFALPFALLGAVLAARGLPALWQLLWITVAMVGARSLKFAWTFTLAAAALFFIAAAMLNRLTLLLAPVALASVLAYSYTKRF